MIREVLKDCRGVVSTVGTMVDSSWPAGARQMYVAMKKNFQSGAGIQSGLSGGLGGILSALNGATSPLGDDEDSRVDETYEYLNRDVHLAVASEAAKSKSTTSFVYFSAVPSNAVNSKVPFVQRYFSTKMETELALAQYEPDELRCTSLRPTVMYDDEHLHTLAPAALSKLSSVLDSMIFAQFGFRDVPHLLPSPPVFVDTVADCAIEAAIDESIKGTLGLENIKKVASEAPLGAR